MFDPQYLIKKEVEEPNTQESHALNQVFSDSQLDDIFDKITVPGLSKEENSLGRQNWNNGNFSSLIIHIKRESLRDNNQSLTDSDQDIPQHKTPKLISELIDVKKERAGDSRQTLQPEKRKLVLKAEKQSERRNLSKYSLKSHKCDQSAYGTTMKDRITRHRKTHSLNKPDKSDQKTDPPHKPRNKQNILDSPDKPFKCDQCSYTAKSKMKLYYHKFDHLPSKPFKCDQCSYAAHHKSKLIIHKANHSLDKPFKCDRCSYATRFKTNLKKHELIHLSDKPFKCDQCSYATHSKASLKSHDLVHSCAKPFKCDQCSYATGLKSSLKRHGLVHSSDKNWNNENISSVVIHVKRESLHDNNQFLTYSDQETPQPKTPNVKKEHASSYAAHHKSKLIIHKANHSLDMPFKCDRCSYATRFKTNLKKHELIHLSDKPFKCDQCSYATHSKACLKSHDVVHSSDKPFKCDKCSYATGLKSSLKRHELVHSSTNIVRRESRKYALVIL